MRAWLAAGRRRFIPIAVGVSLVGAVAASLATSPPRVNGNLASCSYNSFSGTTCTTPTPTTTTAPITTTTTTTSPSNAPAPVGVLIATFGTPASATVVSNAPTTLTEAQGNARASVYVPAGALPAGTTVSLFPVANSAALVASVPKSQSYVVSFAVSWLAPNGTTPAATAPITMTIVDPSVKAGDTIYVLTAKGLRAVGTATGSGRAKITFTSDPVFVVVQPAVLTRVATTAPLTGTAVRVTLSCAPRVNCIGSAALTVAAKTESGTWHRVVLAAGHVAVAGGKARVVTLVLNPTGRRFVAYLERVGHRRIDAVVEAALDGAKKSAYPVVLPIALGRSA